MTAPDTDPIAEQRPLTEAERRLAHWMLEHGEPEASRFLEQLDRARVVSRCPCGCASVDFEVAGSPAPAGALRILGDYVYGSESDLNGIFIFERSGILAGNEVYGLGGDAPSTLPSPTALRPFDKGKAG